MAAAPALDTTTRMLLARLWRGYVARHRRGIVLALACTLGVAATTALYPVVIQQSFDLFTEGRQDVLWAIPLVIVVVTCLKAAAQYGQAVAIQGVVLRVIEAIQNDLFRALTRADLATVAREAPARHAARFTTDAALIREALTKSINAIADALTVVGLVASMVYLDWQMSLVAALLYPIAVVPILRLGKRIRRASGGMQERVGEAAAALTESFGAARVVRAYRLEAAEEARAAGLFARLRESLYGIARTRASLDPLLGRVRRDAVPEAFLVGLADPGRPARTLLVDGPDGRREAPSPVELSAADGSLLPVNGALYRGTLLLVATPRGTLHVVNRVGLEDYLLGVVPLEMGPRVYDELEALKTYVTDRPGHDLRYAIDASKIEREGGWTPKETFETGMRATVKWYLENTEWVRDVRSGAYREWIEKNYGTR